MPDRTLFELLGLTPTATVAEVEAAWTRIVRAHDGDLAAIDDHVKAAYELLREPFNCKYYAELLDACDGDEILDFPEGREVFTAFCTRCGIRWFERPGYPNSFRVRRAGQAVPSWVRYDARAMPDLHMSRRERLGRFVRNFALGEVFRGRSRMECAWIGAGYLIVLLLTWGAVRSVTGSYAAWQRGRVAAAEQRSREAFHVEHAAVQAQLRELEALAGSLSREFQELTQVPLLDAGGPNVKRPRELDLTLIRHASVRDAWATTINEQLRPAELDARKQALAALSTRSTTSAPAADDAKRVAEIAVWARQRLEQLRSHRSNIDHIRVMMQADRLEHGPTATEGSHSP